VLIDLKPVLIDLKPVLIDLKPVLINHKPVLINHKQGLIALSLSNSHFNSKTVRFLKKIKKIETLIYH
jgi:hypothetical protein